MFSVPSRYRRPFVAPPFSFVTRSAPPTEGVPFPPRAPPAGAPLDGGRAYRRWSQEPDSPPGFRWGRTRFSLGWPKRTDILHRWIGRERRSSERQEAFLQEAPSRGEAADEGADADGACEQRPTRQSWAASGLFGSALRRWRTARQTRPGGGPRPKRASLVHRAARLWRSVRWHLTSSVNAVIGRSLAAGKRSAKTAGVRAWEHSKRVCSSASRMADSTFQGIRKSLSSWSLSTVKKPRIIGPKFKMFVGRRKNR